MGDLPMQIRRLDGVSIHETNSPHARAGKVCCCGTAQAACADDEDGRVAEAELAYSISAYRHTDKGHGRWEFWPETFDSDAGQDQLPRVSLVLLRLERPFPRFRWVLPDFLSSLNFPKLLLEDPQLSFQP